MTKPTNPVIAEARKAARGEYAAEHERDYLIRTCERLRQDAPGEQFGHLISVVPVSVIDALLKELGDGE